MYTINIGQSRQQKCNNCENSMVQYVGTQAWCSGCNRAIRTIQQQTRVVPKMYQSNCKEKISSTQLKIKGYLNEFCNKYGGLSDMEEIYWLYKQVLQIKIKKGTGTKNYRENAAVIVYVHFRECHRQSIKQFCKKNQINQKSFNKAYFTYQKLLKEKNVLRTVDSLKDQDQVLKKQQELKKQQYLNTQQDLNKQQELKMESSQESLWETENEQYFGRRGVYSEKETGSGIARELNRPQRSSASSQSTTKNQHFDRPHHQPTIQHLLLTNLHLHCQIRSFLNSVFESFFHSLIYANKKEQLIQELSEQILEAYQTLKLLIESTGSPIYVALEGFITDGNFYRYLFYFVLRKISHGVSQVKYKKLVHEATGETIKPTLLKSLIKALDLKEETTSSFSVDSLFFLQNSGTTGSEFVKLQEKEE